MFCSREYQHTLILLQQNEKSTPNMRIHNTEMIPQLDGPISVCSRRIISENARTEQEPFQRTTVTHRREYPDENSNDSHSGRRAYNDQRPPERRYQEGSGRPPDGGNNQDRG